MLSPAFPPSFCITVKIAKIQLFSINSDFRPFFTRLKGSNTNESVELSRDFVSQIGESNVTLAPVYSSNFDALFDT